MSNALIRQAFESRLKHWAASKSPPIPIAWENVPFTPPATRYLQSFFMPNETTSETLDRLHRGYRGIYQVSIVEPINQDPRLSDALADELDKVFSSPRLTAASGIQVQLVSPMFATAGVQSGGRYITAVSTSYRADSRLAIQTA